MRARAYNFGHMGRGLALKCITLGFAGRDTIAHRYTPYSCAPHAACCCLAAQITASDACVNMVTVAESRRRSALVGTACQRVLLDSSGESHGCVHSCVDDHVDFEPHQVRLSTGEATRRKPAQRVSSVAHTRSREPPSTSGGTASRGGGVVFALWQGTIPTIDVTRTNITYPATF